MTTAWTVCTNENLFFDQNKNRKLAKKWQSLHFYALIFWWKKGSLHRNGNAAIPKRVAHFFNPKICCRSKETLFKHHNRLLWLSGREMAPTRQRPLLKSNLCARMMIIWEEQLVDPPIAYITSVNVKLFSVYLIG